MPTKVAFRIPNLLRDLFAEGALSAAFVPTYARLLVQEGRARAFQLACRLLTLLAVLLGGGGPPRHRVRRPPRSLLAPGFDVVPGKTEAAVLLTRVMMPFLPLVSFAALAMGMLNAEERFGIPALSPAMFNVATVGWGLRLLWAGLPIDQVALGWSMGTLLGGIAQFAVQVPALRRPGLSLSTGLGSRPTRASARSRC